MSLNRSIAPFFFTIPAIVMFLINFSAKNGWLLATGYVFLLIGITIIATNERKFRKTNRAVMQQQKESLHPRPVHDLSGTYEVVDVKKLYTESENKET